MAQWIVDDRRPPEIEKILARGSVHWEYFNTLLADQELYPFAYSFLRDYVSLVPAGEVDLLKRSYYLNVSRLARLQKDFVEILDLFRARGLDVLPLKGTAFLCDSMYGGKSLLRPMADIDILVKKEKLVQAEELFEASGYRKALAGLTDNYWKEKGYHISFAKKVIKEQRYRAQIEMHWLLDYPRKISLLPSLWDRVVKVQAEDREVALLSPEDTLFCLALHVRRFGNVLSLKSACDCARLLTRHKDLDWDYIVKEARNGHMRASVYFRLIQAKIYFDIPVPAFLLKGLGLAPYRRHMLERFILKNTFAGFDKTGKGIFLENHFLVYDNFREPALMIFNVPQEQFAKFYGLQPYSRKTSFLYRLRLLYYPYFLCVQILKATVLWGSKMRAMNEEFAKGGYA